jgi:hypothetical protein
MADQREFKIKITVDSAQGVSAAKQQADALTEVKNVATTASREDAAGSATAQKATEKLTDAKKTLKEGIKGVALQIPFIGRFAQAINPVTASVGGVAAAFALWNRRVKEALFTLSGFELPDLSKMDPAKVTVAAEAWKTYSEALKQTVEQYTSVEAASSRAMKAIEDEAGRKKKVAEAQKNLELAQAKTAEERMGIEDRYARFGMAADNATRQAMINEQKKEAAALREDAAAKTRKAGGIKVASEKTDAQNEDDLRAAAEVAQKEIDMRRGRVGDVVEGQGRSFLGNLASPVEMAKFYMRYGLGTTGGEAYNMEHEGIDRAQVAVDRYKNFMRNKDQRSDLRSERSGLLTDSGKQVGQAAGIDSDAGIAQQNLGADMATAAQVADLQSQTRATEALAKNREGERQVLDEIAGAIEAGRGVSAATLRKLQEYRAEQEDIKRRIASLEGSRKSNPPGT